jgi:Rod binding domain-containing protein
MKIDATFSTPQTMPSAAELATKLPKNEKLGKACDQFEGMLIRQILNEGLKPLLAKTPGSSAAGAGVYDYMLTDTLAKGITGPHSVGISHLLQQQLAPRVPHTPPAIPDAQS